MPSYYQRAVKAINVFRFGYPNQAKKFAVSFPDWMQNKPQWHLYDLQTYVEEGYNINPVIRGAVDFKMRQVSMAPPRAYVGDPQKPELAPPDNPVSKLLSRPNAHQSSMEFMQQNIVYLNLAGNVYIVLDREKPGAYPRALYSLRPDRVKIIPGKGGIKGYVYQIEGKTSEEIVPILPEDMMHVKLPNPGDPLEGMGEGLSPIMSLARSADVDNSGSDFLKMFFDRGTQGFGFVEVEESLPPETIARLREEWDDRYGGSENWGRPILLDSGAKWKPGSTSLQDMDFSWIDQRNESRIHGPLGVPPILTGSGIGLERSTFSNYEEARKAFWEDTFSPELGLFEEDFTYYLSDGNTFVRFDKSRVPALRKDIKALAEAAEIMIRNGVPPNTAWRLVGLEDVGEIEGGDVSYFPTTLVPMSMAGTQLLPLPAPGGETSEGAPNVDEDERLLTDGKAKKKFIPYNSKQPRQTG